MCKREGRSSCGGRQPQWQATRGEADEKGGYILVFRVILWGLGGLVVQAFLFFLNCLLMIPLLSVLPGVGVGESLFEKWRPVILAPSVPVYGIGELLIRAFGFSSSDSAGALFLFLIPFNLSGFWYGVYIGSRQRGRRRALKAVFLLHFLLVALCLVLLPFV